MIELGEDTLVGSDAVLHIRAQSTATDFESVDPIEEAEAPTGLRRAILSWQF